jgi:GAF domain-containing protein
MDKIYKNALEQGYKVKEELIQLGIIDQQIGLAIQSHQDYREFEYKNRTFAVKRTLWGWNLYECFDANKR